MHLSFDFWNTLAVFNPKFSAARVACLARHMGVDEATASAQYIAVKRAVDKDAELTGASYESPYIFASTMKRVRPDISWTDVMEILAEVQQLALRDPPIFHHETMAAVRDAVAAGYSVSITSNTNFVTGETIRAVLDKTNFPYDFGLFSDELPFAKPHPEIFKMVRARVEDTRPIIHFGDHAICDVEGANKAGVRGVLVSYDNLAEVIRDVTAVVPA